ncbi:MAG TPA: DNA mismatch endonuclease Vsr [Ignavibacteria bacterium]
MASVRNKGTEPEVRLRKALFRMGYRYKINDKTLPGSPDIVLPKYKSVIFIHGCFWHGHSGCSKAIKPKSNIEFWKSKIRKNKLRDQKANSELRKLEWNILVVWDCELRNIKSFNSIVNRLDKILQAHC